MKSRVEAPVYYLHIFLPILGIVLLSVAGDYFIKIAADKNEVFSAAFLIGFSLYSVTTVFWFYAMRYLPLNMIAVLYSSMTVIGLVLLGVFTFGEHFGTRQLIGLLLALAAIIVIES